MHRIASPTPPLQRLRDFGRELRGAGHFAVGSRPRFWLDTVGYRALRLAPSLASNRVRTLRLKDGTRISYRLNRGDIQAIREIWLSPTYEPPFRVGRLPVVVDVGANIGFTSVYLARRHGAHTCVAVEPDAGNARLLRRNLEQNGIRATVLEAAVGEHDGFAHFAASAESNLGRVADRGTPVRLLSMPTLLGQLGDKRIALLKVDIEGGEEALFAGDTSWLDRVDAIMIEFHPKVVEPGPIVSRIESHGFRHLPSGSVRHGTTDAFVRERAPA